MENSSRGGGTRPRCHRSTVLLFAGGGVPETSDGHKHRDSRSRMAGRQATLQLALLAQGKSRPLPLHIATRVMSSFASQLGSPMAPDSRPSAAELAKQRGSGGDGKGGEEKPKYDNWFYRNPGYVMLSIFGSIVTWLVRGSYSGADRTRVEEALEATTFVEPDEILEVCDGNKVSALEFKELVRQGVNLIGPGRTSYPEFLMAMTRLLREQRPNARQVETLKAAHIIDRAVFGMLSAELARERGPGAELPGTTTAGAAEAAEATEEWEGLIGVSGKERSVLRRTLPVRSLFVALSMIIDSNVLETGDALFDVLSATSADGIVRRADAVGLVAALQDSAQLPCFSQVIKNDEWIPYQKYRVATAEELVRMAERDKKNPVDLQEPITSQALQALLHSSAVNFLGQGRREY